LEVLANWAFARKIPPRFWQIARRDIYDKILVVIDLWRTADERGENFVVKGERGRKIEARSAYIAHNQ